jgi:hypothetical protein
MEPDAARADAGVVKGFSARKAELYGAPRDLYKFRCCRSGIAIDPVDSSILPW